MAERKSYLLRIAPDLWADLEAWAANELRSVNGQIEYLLRQAVLKRKGAALAKGAAARSPASPKHRSGPRISESTSNAANP